MDTHFTDTHIYTTKTTHWCHIPRVLGGTQLFFGRDVQPERRNGGLKNYFFSFFCSKVRSKELKTFNILRAYELKFRLQNWKFLNVWQISLAGVKIYYFCSKWRSKELNLAATGDLKNGERGVKRGLDRQTHPYHLFRLVPPRVTSTKDTQRVL